MAYSRNYFVHNYDCDISGRLSLPSMIKYFEDIALLQSEEVGYGMNYYLTENVIWILHKWNIEIFERPFFMDNVKIVTNPYSYKSFFANREFEIYSEEGDLLVRADTVWIFLDTKTRKPKCIDTDVMKAYDIGEDGPDNFDKLFDLEVPDSFDHAIEYNIRKSDIDLNNHLNNVRYIELAIEALPDEITEDYELGAVRVVFKKEMLLDDKMSIKVKDRSTEIPLVFSHPVFNEKNEICAVIETEWS